MRDFIKNYYILSISTIHLILTKILYFTLRQSSYLMLIKFNCYGTGNAIRLEISIILP